MLSNIFQRAARDITTLEAVNWLQTQPGYEKFSELPKYFIHDLMHIRIDGIAPTGANERRAGIMEYYDLSASLQISKIEDDRLVRTGPDIEMDAICEAYADNGRESLRRKIETHKNQYAGTGDSALIEMIKKLESFLTPHDLTPYERECAIIRAQTLSRYFREQHDGKRLSDFPVSEVKEMTLLEVGIIPVRVDDIVRFEPVIDIPKPVFV